MLSGAQRQGAASNSTGVASSCGAKTPGTKSGNAVADHQPAQALAEPLEFVPHCLKCLRVQAGRVTAEVKRRLKEAAKKQ